MSRPQGSSPPSPASPFTPDAPLPLHRRRGARQFVKFGIVGASSTAINFAALYLMLTLLHGHRYISATIAFLVSVGNGYIWNKRWTFKEAQAKALHTQFGQFLLVNLVGLLLDLLIIRLISVPLEHEVHHLWAAMTPARVEKAAVMGAQLVATAVVVFWNFYANRRWTFQH